MTHARRLSLSWTAAVAVALLPGSVALMGGGADESAGALPKPYRLVENPLTLPTGRSFGYIMGIDVDRNGKDVWVMDTCGGDLQDCLTSKTDPIMKFDASGKFIKSFGSGMVAHPHGLYIDASNNIWIVDGFGGTEKNPTKGHQVFKFSPDGKLLMTLGKAGVRGETDATFNNPSDVLVAPTGDI